MFVPVSDAAPWFIWIGIGAQIVGLLVARFDFGHRLSRPGVAPATDHDGSGPPGSIDFVVGRPRSEPVVARERRVVGEGFVARAGTEPVVEVEVGGRRSTGEHAASRPSGDSAMTEMTHRHERLQARREREDHALGRIWRGLAIATAGVCVTAFGVTASASDAEPSGKHDEPTAVTSTDPHGLLPDGDD